MILKFRMKFHRPRTNSFLTIVAHATYLGEAKAREFQKLGRDWILTDWGTL